MSKQVLNLAVGILCLLFFRGCTTQHVNNSIRQEVIINDSVELFNGKNLNGWYTFLKNRGRNNDPKQVFSVHDNMIHITGEEYGCITTESEYSRYKLDVEFRWGAKTFAPRLENARDNGILLHSVGTDGAYDGNWMHSIECQIIEGGTGDIIVVGDGSDRFSVTSTISQNEGDETFTYKAGGDSITIHKGRINWFGRDKNWKDVKDFRGNVDVERPVGEWNHLQCVVDSTEMAIYLNGVMVNHAFNVKPSGGRIQIQSEGAEIFFRKVLLYQMRSK